MDVSIETPRKTTPLSPSSSVFNPAIGEPTLVFLKAAVAAILSSGVLVSLSMYFLLPDMRDQAYRTSSILIVGIAGWYFLYRNRPKATLLTLSVGMWSYVALLAFLGGGITAPVQYIFPLIIFMLGWLVGTRIAGAVTMLTGMFTVFAVVADSRGWLPASPAYPLWLHAMVQICVVAMAVVLVHFLVRAYQRKMFELDQINASLAARSRDLEVVKAELHQAQAQAKVGSWVYTVATDTMQLSDEACRIFDLTPSRTLNRKEFLALTPERERLAVEAAWRHASREQPGFEYEHCVHVREDMHWVLQKAVFERDAQGATIRVVGVTQDIDARKQVELTLRQSERKFATAFQSSPVAASIATLADGRFVEANQKYLRDFGWAREELIGRTTADINLWPSAEVRAQWVEALKARGSIVEYETTWVHRNGDLRSVSISGEVIDYAESPCILAFITDITSRKAAEAQIHNLAFFDALTGLPNRRLLLNRLELAMSAAHRHQRHGGLLFIDLDNFKSLNDTHGHNKGDLLLKQVAGRLSTCVREGDTVSRLGGDEFVVMLDNLHEDAVQAASQAEAVAEKILSQLDRYYDVAGILFHNTPSIGVTLFGAHLENLEEPLKRADTAMYQAKAAGRNAIRFFNPDMQSAVAARLQVETELRIAITCEAFHLVYQPQVDIDGRVTGAEALVRWRHSERGIVSPAEFIPVAESTGLILPLGTWILEAACTQLALWAQQPLLANLDLAVNVSARQFRHVDFVATVLATLEKTGANPQHLKLELTESMLIDDIDAVISKIATLKSHQVGFSLDDFGTGYSSLAYLKQLPLDQLKIDQGFVRDLLLDPNDAAIARMVIVLAETLGLTVIAEGVETAAQHEALAVLGCKNFQGYYFSRPMNVDELSDFVAARPGLIL
jgi:diguanylate cyclase (GGDEF)-like protein/PAS domain S-box-containing protein